MSRPYVVIPHDSLWKIASRELKDALKWEEIARLNSLEAPYTIYVGQVLELPETSRAGATGRPPPGAKPPYMTPQECRPSRTPKPPRSADKFKGKVAAHEVGYPTLKFKLPLAELIQLAPPFEIKAALDLEVSLSHDGVLRNIVFNNEGVAVGGVSQSTSGGVQLGLKQFFEENIQVAVQGLDTLYADAKIGFNGVDADPAFSLESSLTAKARTDLYVAELKIKGPDHWVFEVKPNPVKGKLEHGWSYEGELGGSIEVKRNRAARRPQPVPVVVPLPEQRPVKREIKINIHPEPVGGPRSHVLPFLVAAGYLMKKLAAMGALALNAATSFIIIIDPSRIPGPHHPGQRGPDWT